MTINTGFSRLALGPTLMLFGVAAIAIGIEPWVAFVAESGGSLGLESEEAPDWASPSWIVGGLLAIAGAALFVKAGLRAILAEHVDDEDAPTRP